MNSFAEIKDWWAEKLDLKVGQRLGSGTQGVAYDIGDGKILKVTTDESEAAAAAALVGKKLRGVYQVDASYAAKNSQARFAIIQEKLKPISSELDELFRWTSRHILLGAIYGLMNKLSPEEAAESIEMNWQAQFESIAYGLQKYSPKVYEYVLNNLKKTADIMATMPDYKGKFTKKQVDAAIEVIYGLLNLRKMGITFSDVHSGNVMMRGSKPVLIDIGYSKGSSAKPKVVEYARIDMPQIFSGDLIEFVESCRRSGIPYSKKLLDPKSLKPTQSEFDDVKVKKLIANPSKKPILASKDGFVIDGHHRWKAALESGSKIPAIVQQATAEKVRHLAHAFNKSFTKQLHEGIPDHLVLTIGAKLGIDWKKVDFDEFAVGIEIELEHGAHDPETDVIGNDLFAAGKIAWAHLKEVPDYYTKLDKYVEEGYKDKYGRPSAAKRGYGHAWRKIREEIIARDKGVCALCGKPGKEVDHVKAKVNGGEDKKQNLRVLCGACHRKKTKKVDYASNH